MTDTPIAGAVQPVIPQSPRQSLWSKIHADTTAVWHVFSRLFPIMEKIALNPALDQLFEEALMAADDGVAAEAFAAATDALRGARRRQAAATAPPDTGPQPSFQAAQDNPVQQLPVTPGLA